MAIITRVLTAFLMVAAALPLIAAYPGGGQPGSSKCKDNEFWFEEKSCCLPQGGPHGHHTPPPEKQCPPGEWSWSDEHSCCVPHRPYYPQQPQCHKDWDWSRSSFCCEQKPRKPPGGHGCKKYEFWFAEKECCVRRDGPTDNYKPPGEKQCPPKDWSWSKEHNCCVPHHEHYHPHPQCHKDWDWSRSSFCCERRRHHPY